MEGGSYYQRAGVINEERVAALVSELVNGGRKQTTGVLQRLGDNPGFCCLGVACEVAIEGGLKLRRIQDERRCIIYTFDVADGLDHSPTVLPGAAVAWYGFPDDNPALKVPQRLLSEVDDRVANSWTPTLQVSAAELNDQYHFTLPQIGECFQYTFLREQWEAQHGADAA